MWIKNDQCFQALIYPLSVRGKSKNVDNFFMSKIGVERLRTQKFSALMQKM